MAGELTTEGTAQSRDVVKLIADVAAYIRDAKADGKFDAADGLKAIGLVPQLISAVKGLEMIPGELAHMNGEEKDALILSFSHAFEDLYYAFVKPSV